MSANAAKIQSALTFADAVYMLRKYDSSMARRAVDTSHTIWYIWNVRMGGVVSVIDGTMSGKLMDSISVESASSRDWEVWL